MSPWEISLTEMARGGDNELEMLLPISDIGSSGEESAGDGKSVNSPHSTGDISPHGSASGNQLILSDERHDRASIEDVECVDEPAKDQKNPEVPLQVCSIGSSSGNNSVSSTENDVEKDAIKRAEAASNNPGNGEVKKDKENTPGKSASRGNKKALYRPKLEKVVDHPLSTLAGSAECGRVGDAIVSQNCPVVHGTGGQETKGAFERSQGSTNPNPLQGLKVVPAEDFDIDDIEEIFRGVFSSRAGESVQGPRPSIIGGRRGYYPVRSRSGYRYTALENTSVCSSIGDDEEDEYDEEAGDADDEREEEEEDEEEEEEE